MRVTAVLAPASLAIVMLGACTTGTITAAAVAACGPDAVATTSSDVVLVNDYEAALYYASVDAIPVSFYDGPASIGQSAAAASAVVMAVRTYFPSGCATATASGGVVTFMLDNCSGPLDLVGATGTVTAMLIVQSGKVGVQLSGVNLSVNGATINLATSGTVTASDGQKTLTSNTQTTGTGPNGNTISHTGTYTMVWTPGSGCASINGALSSTSPAGNVTGTQITNYVACAGKCPQSGTSLPPATRP
jgi:hypothetical protein